jgi:hypothetical protein
MPVSGEIALQALAMMVTINQCTGTTWRFSFFLREVGYVLSIQSSCVIELFGSAHETGNVDECASLTSIHATGINNSNNLPSYQTITNK